MQSLFLVWIEAVKHLKLPSDNTENTGIFSFFFFFFLSLQQINRIYSLFLHLVCQAAFFVWKADERVNECHVSTGQTATRRLRGIKVKVTWSRYGSAYHSNPKDFQSTVIVCRRSQWFFTGPRWQEPPEHTCERTPKSLCLEVLSYRALQPGGETYLGLRKVDVIVQGPEE